MAADGRSIREVVAFILMVTSPAVLWQALSLGLGSDYPVMVVASSSMAPALHVGDMILVQRVNPRDVSEGTVIVFHSPLDGDEACYVHRVVGKIRDGEDVYYLTKGDANHRLDPWIVPHDLLVGRLYWKMALIGYVMLLPKEFMLIAIGSVLTVDVAYVVRFRRSDRARSDV